MRRTADEIDEIGHLSDIIGDFELYYKTYHDLRVCG